MDSGNKRKRNIKRLLIFLSAAVLVIACAAVTIIRAVVGYELLSIITDPNPNNCPNTLWRCEEKELFFVVDDHQTLRTGRTVDGEARWIVIDTRKNPYFTSVWEYRRGENNDPVNTGSFHIDSIECRRGSIAMTYKAEDDTEQIFGPAEGEVTLHFYLAEELPGPVSFTDTGYVLGDGTEVPWVEPAS